MCNDVYWNKIFSRNRDSYLSFQFQHISPVFLQTDGAVQQPAVGVPSLLTCRGVAHWLRGGPCYTNPSDLVRTVSLWKHKQGSRWNFTYFYAWETLPPGWVSTPMQAGQSRAAWQCLKWSRLRHATVIWSSEVTLMMPAFWRLAALLKCNPSLQDG